MFFPILISNIIRLFSSNIFLFYMGFILAPILIQLIPYFSTKSMVFYHKVNNHRIVSIYWSIIMALFFAIQLWLIYLIWLEELISFVFMLAGIDMLVVIYIAIIIVTTFFSLIFFTKHIKEFEEWKYKRKPLRVSQYFLLSFLAIIIAVWLLYLIARTISVIIRLA